MNIISQPSYSLIFKQLFLISIFIIFSIPYSIDFGGGSSANYSFIFFPMMMILLTGIIKIPNNNMTIIILIFCFIFLISLLYQFDFYKYHHRRILSFFIFMTIFSYLFINVTDEMVKAFKIAIVVFSCVYSLMKIGDYYLLNPEFGGKDLGFTAKTSVGSQRFGFMFILAFWILAFYQPRLKSIKILKIVCILIILLGLLNTFSRTSILALLSSVIIFFYTKIDLKSTFQSLLRFLTYLFIFLFISFLMFKVFPYHSKFYLDRIYFFIVDGGIFNEIIDNDPDDSLGYRIVILKKIWNFVVYNPFTGSGFLGCWVMFESLSCSAHSQFADVLFRTGILGLCVYIYLLFRILKFLRTTHRDLFFGFIAILIYGFAHETFKLSHGAFILSFLVGMTYNKKINCSLLKNKI